MRFRTQWVGILLVAGLAILIAFLALRPSPYLRHIPWMPRDLGYWVDRNGVLRNAVAFFVLALPVYLFVGSRWWHAAGLAVFATLLEVAQLGIRSRVFDWRDIVASVAGIAVAWPLAWIARRVMRR
ncbi:MAG: VanZ family protein [Opitutaceae bacterium]|nr:VanZ family protein [Opitutaceae bacterium]